MKWFERRPLEKTSKMVTIAMSNFKRRPYPEKRVLVSKKVKENFDRAFPEHPQNRRFGHPEHVYGILMAVSGTALVLFVSSLLWGSIEGAAWVVVGGATLVMSFLVFLAIRYK